MMKSIVLPSDLSKKLLAGQQRVKAILNRLLAGESLESVTWHNDRRPKMNRLTEIGRVSLQAYLSTKLKAGELNMSQYEAAEAATGFLGTKITRDNVLGAMQKLKRKWPTKRTYLCRSLKEYNCSSPSCNFKSTSPVAVKAHYGEFPLHAPPKKGRKMANTMTTDKLEEARIKKSVGKIATKPLSKLKINELRKLSGAMGLLDGGVGIGATKVEYTALIEAKRNNNKRGITIITKRIAARNAAKKEKAAQKLTPAGQAAEAVVKKATESKKTQKYHCHNPKCSFKATSGHGIAQHYIRGACPKLAPLRHPGGNMPNVDLRRVEDPEGAKLVDARDKAWAGTQPKTKSGKYRCHNHSGGCDFTATSGTGVRQHYANGLCPKLAPAEQSPVADIVQHRCAEITVTKVDLNFCCNCQCDLTKHREGLGEGYSVKFCPDCGMPLPSFPS